LDSFVRKRLIMLSTSLWDQIKSRAQESRIGTLIGQLDAALKETKIEKNSFGEKYSINLEYAPLLCSQRTTQWGWRVRGRPQHGDLGSNYSGVLREVGHLGCVCDQARGLMSIPLR
jgi:hypothetical protein